ncbi:hypothetical protein DL769_007229 [Monosporascus sp. CRB-8-3]|nr:hypothetical protein DL769_007229 [Monosporascus sp. CRB-8-3]
MMGIEPPMGRDTENLLTTQRTSQGEAPTISRHRDGREDRKQWYKEIRLDSCCEFWAKTARAQRDDMRAAAQNPAADLAHLIHQVKVEDGSHMPDAFWDYQRDEAAAADPHIYERVRRHVVILADENSHIIPCKFKGLSRCCLVPRSCTKVERRLGSGRLLCSGSPISNGE